MSATFVCLTTMRNGLLSIMITKHTSQVLPMMNELSESFAPTLKDS